MFYSTAVYAISQIVDPDLEAINFAKALRGKNGNSFQEISVYSEVFCQDRV